MKLASIGNVGTGLMNVAARASAVLQIIAATDPGSTGSLAPGRVEVLRLGKGRTIGCTEGWLWVTTSGDTKDYVLKQGENLVIPSPGRIFVDSPRGGAYRLN